MRPLIYVLAVLVVASACSEEADEPVAVEAPVPGAGGPREAVVELAAALAAEDFERAAELTVDGQAVAVAVVEDTPAAEIVVVIEDGGGEVLATFWSSFSSSFSELVDSGPDGMEVDEASEPFEVGGVRFALVPVRIPGEPDRRTFVAREVDGWKVDVVGTFATGLAPKLAQAPEALADEPDGAVVIVALTEHRPALEAALTDPGFPAGLRQSVRAAIVALGG